MLAALLAIHLLIQIAQLVYIYIYIYSAPVPPLQYFSARPLREHPCPVQYILYQALGTKSFVPGVDSCVVADGCLLLQHKTRDVCCSTRHVFCCNGIHAGLLLLSYNRYVNAAMLHSFKYLHENLNADIQYSPKCECLSEYIH